MLQYFFITNIFSIFMISFAHVGFWVFSNKNQESAKVTTLLFSILMTLQMLYSVLEAKTWGTFSQFNLSLDLIAINLKLHFALEGLSVMFCFLTALLTFICILLIWDKKFFYEQAVCLLALQFFVVSAFTVTDIFFFYVFFEAVVIPMYIMIVMFGSRNRKIRAANLLLYYTLVSSAMLLLAIGGIYSFFGTTDYSVLLSESGLRSLPRHVQDVLWVIFFVAFATKMPLVPFHTWLPEAHVEASTPGSVLLAGILLKLGLYGLIVFCIGMLPDPSVTFAPYVFLLSIVGAVYTGIIAIRQQDLKRVIAYSSVSHMCATTLGVFSQHTGGVQAALFQGVSHGFISVGLFALIGFIYDRFGSRDIQKYSGLTRLMPMFSIFFLFFTLANLAMPGFSSFVGEFGIMYAAFTKSIVGGLVLLTTVIVVGGYSLLLSNRILFGDLNKVTLELLEDINRREIIICLVLAFFVILLGVQPRIVSDLFNDDLSPILAFLYQF